MSTPGGAELRHLVVVRAGGRLVGIPCDRVVETMRPLPVEGAAAGATAVLGLCILRGAPAPVIDIGRMFRPDAATMPRRFVSLRVGERVVAAGVDEVIGVHALASSQLAALPPLLGATDSAAIEAIGTLDGELLSVLRASNLVPEDAWQGRLESGAAGAVG